MKPSDSPVRTGVAKVTAERIAREAEATRIARTLPITDYYVADNELRREDDRTVAYTADSHWDACLIMMAVHERKPENWADAYGRTGKQSDCDVCQGSGVEYDETCVTCGGFGWVRA